MNDWRTVLNINQRFIEIYIRALLCDKYEKERTWFFGSSECNTHLVMIVSVNVMLIRACFDQQFRLMLLLTMWWRRASKHINSNILLKTHTHRKYNLWRSLHLWLLQGHHNVLYGDGDRNSDNEVQTDRGRENLVVMMMKMKMVLVTMSSEMNRGRGSLVVAMMMKTVMVMLTTNNDNELWDEQRLRECGRLRHQF